MRKIMLAMLSLMAFSAQARGEEAHPEWLNERQWRTPNDAHCCDKHHCRLVRYGELVATNTGYRHLPTQTEITSDKPGIYPTKDPGGRMYLCIMDGKLVCVFEGISG